MEPESTSFDPRTWVQPGAAGAGPAEASAPSRATSASEAARPAPRRGLLWLGGALGGALAAAAVGLLVPWGSIFGEPVAEARGAAAPGAGGPAAPAAPPLATMIFQAADLAQLGTGLEGIGIPAGDALVAAEELVAALGTIEPMTVTVELDKSGAAPAIHALTAELANGAAVRLVRAGEGRYTRETVVETAKVRIREASGTYNHNTFYASAVEAGIPNGLVSDFTAAFAFDVDWAQIRIGDRFRAVWEETVSASGREVEPPRLIAVEFETGGIRRSFFAYVPTSEAIPRWFDESGKGNARSLMRTPVDGARITSKFGPRMHPIYKTAKNHNGVDFAAPTGTPIFAAGKGTVIFRAMAGGAGNLVKIDHGDGLETRYMHLDGFAPDLAVGAPVTQGQVIGYVGTTGGSTGPHLHFEIRTDGVYVDPLSFENTVTEALSGEELRMYAAQRKATFAEVAQSRQAAAAPPAPRTIPATAR